MHILWDVLRAHSMTVYIFLARYIICNMHNNISYSQGNIFCEIYVPTICNIFTLNGLVKSFIIVTFKAQRQRL